ncbi:MAG: thiamine-phosphate kinase [Candidatus Hodarchaeota archaeon]
MRNLENLGEQEIIRLLQPYIDPSDLLGTNEDAYLVNNTHPYVIINVDTMSRKSDFLPGQTWTQIGAKLVSITFSDLAAKGANPTLFLSSMVLEKSILEKEIRELTKSFQKAAHKYGAKYLGGDLGSAFETVLTGVGLGSIIEGEVLARNRAQPGDLVCVTGYFGLTTIGLNHLLSPSSDKYSNISNSLLKQTKELLYNPEPKIVEGTLLSKNRLANASIDSSDGLAISLHWLSQASKVGIVIKTLPIHPQLDSYFDSNQTLLDITMFGGEEYELVFTVSPHRIQELEEIFDQHGCKFIVIGECTSSEGVFFSQNGEKTPLAMRGWDPFLKKEY